MKLKKIIKDVDVEVVKGSKEIEITGITSDSRVVAPGNLFIALKGETYDGGEFIDKAILAGASCILTDIFNPFLQDVTQLIAKDIESVVPLLAKNFWQDPSSKLMTVGITGTNGKTTTSYLIKHLLDFKAPTGLIGTIERIIGNYRTSSDLTTPDVLTNHKLMHEMLLSGLKNACMEVSSHGLDMGRVKGLLYDVVVFTNLTPEHLDYHHTMDAYAAAKASLFSSNYTKESAIAVVNRDSPWTKRILEGFDKEVITYGLSEGSDYRAVEMNYKIDRTHFVLKYQGTDIPMRVPLVGEYNVYNTLAAIAVAHQKGLSLEEIEERLISLPPIKGRLQKVKNKQGFHIFVDFAHKPDALKSVLETLKEISTGKVITVFGCGGNRDREKRPKMAREAEEYSDLVILTSDNPRNEDPEEIIREVQSGFTKKSHLICIDRREAIDMAISKMSRGDILLIAGRGHELCQIQKFQRVDFDDVKVAEEIANVLS